MGLASSTILDYEEAQKRCTEKELDRWNRSFQRLKDKMGLLDKGLFVKHVLGNQVPTELADRIFRVFSNNQPGIGWRDFVCNMVVFLKGSQEEKLLFVFYVYGGNDAVITKQQMEKFLSSVFTREEMVLHKAEFETAFKDSEDGEKLSYFYWKNWVLDHKDTDFPLLEWIFDSRHVEVEEEEDVEANVPLARSAEILPKTGFSRRQFYFLYESYQKLLEQNPIFRKRGTLLDRMALMKTLCPPVVEELIPFLFDAFFVSKYGEFLDVESYLIGLSTIYFEKSEEKRVMLFKAFDKENTGHLSQQDFQLLLKMVLESEANSIVPINYKPFHAGGELQETVPLKQEEGDETISLEKFESWASENRFGSRLFIALKQAIHIHLGLIPATPREEYDIIMQMMDHEVKKKKEGDTWFVIKYKWWQQWMAFTTVPVGSENRRPQEPGEIDVHDLIQPKGDLFSSMISMVSRSSRMQDDEPRLIPNLQENINFKLVPGSIWRALCGWYANFGVLRVLQKFCIPWKQISEFWIIFFVDFFRHGTTNHRGIQVKVVKSKAKEQLEIEVYPVLLRFFLEPPVDLPKRGKVEEAEFYFSKTITLGELKRNACFQAGVGSPLRVRIWQGGKTPKDEAASMEDRLKLTLEDLEYKDGQWIILEIQQEDGTWPRGGGSEPQEIYPIFPGRTGLRNLGNTCFMNSSLQCLSNINLLTEYFTSNRYIAEINKDNPLGMNGHVANAYGKLIKQMWPTDPNKKSVTENYVVQPKDFKVMIGKFAPQFSGFAQQDAQELLSFLLDGLHEDLNRILKKPATSNPDYLGQPDAELADEFWNIYLLRNKSIIVDLFQGQMKSTVLPECGHKSVNFDPYTFLSLPLPIDDKRAIEVYFFTGDPRATPRRYSILLHRLEGTVPQLLQQVSTLVGLPSSRYVLTAVQKNYICSVVTPKIALKDVADILYGFELAGDLGEDGGKVEEMKVEGEEEGEKGEGMAVEGEEEKGEDEEGLVYLHVLHRKIEKERMFFISPYTSQLFSIPFVISFEKSKTPTVKEFYKMVEEKVKFMVEDWEKEKEEGKQRGGGEKGKEKQGGPKEDEEEGKEKEGKGEEGEAEEGPKYPFVLRQVNEKGESCPLSSWYHYSLGRTLDPASSDPLDLPTNGTIAVDWDPPVYSLKYYRDNGKWYEEHESVKENWDLLNSPIALDQCLTWFTQEEDLGDEVFCGKCQEPKNTKKKMEIWKLPKILIVHLKRFVYYNNHWMKSNRLVQFPVDNFDASSWIVDSNGSPLIYDLQAVVNHYGRLGSGHYTAYAKDSTNTWMCFDDNSVTPVKDLSKIASPEGYCLFYQLRGIDKDEILKGDPVEIDEEDEKNAVGELPPERKDPAAKNKNANENCKVM